MNALARRQLLTGLVALVATPAIVRASSLMAVKRIPIAGNTIYVDGGFAGVSDGSITRPWATLQQAMDYIGHNFDLEGQTVVVQLAAGVYAPATYRGPAPVDLFIDGTAPLSVIDLGK